MSQHRVIKSTLVSEVDLIEIQRSLNTCHSGYAENWWFNSATWFPWTKQAKVAMLVMPVTHSRINSGALNRAPIDSKKQPTHDWVIGPWTKTWGRLFDEHSANPSSDQKLLANRACENDPSSIFRFKLCFPKHWTVSHERLIGCNFDRWLRITSLVCDFLYSTQSRLEPEPSPGHLALPRLRIQTPTLTQEKCEANAHVHLPAGFVMDLPGFYYDATRKKYFRITPGPTGHVLLNESEAKVRKQQDLAKRHLNESRIKMPNFVDSLIQVQQGRKSSCQLGEQLMRIRLMNLYKSRGSNCILSDVDLRMRDNSPKCIMAKYNNENNLLYAVWVDFGSSTLARITIDNLSSSRTGEKSQLRSTRLGVLAPCSSVLDFDFFCGNYDAVFCLNHRLRKSSCLLVESQSRDHDDAYVRKLNFEFEDSFQSCAAGDGKFALGGDKQFKVFHYNETADACTSYKLPWRVSAMKFLDCDSRSEILITTSNGFIRLYDTRTRNYDSNLGSRLGYYSVNCITQVDRDKLLISGHSNNLCLVDKRNFKHPILKFSGHINSSHKLEPSVDVTARVVCSPGEDCVTRFWSLDSANLLTQLPMVEGIKIKSGHLLHSWFSGTLPDKFILSLYGNKVTQCALWSSCSVPCHHLCSVNFFLFSLFSPRI